MWAQKKVSIASRWKVAVCLVCDRNSLDCELVSFLDQTKWPTDADEQNVASGVLACVLVPLCFLVIQKYIHAGYYTLSLEGKASTARLIVLIRHPLRVTTVRHDLRWRVVREAA